MKTKDEYAIAGDKSGCSFCPRSWPNCIAARYSLAMMGFMGTFTVYSLRMCISPAIVAMVNYTAVEDLNILEAGNQSDTPITETCPQLKASSNSTTTSAVTSGGEFIWDESDQGRILAAYFYGYALTQTPGAYLGRRYSRVRVWGFCMLLASLATMLTPLATSSGGLTGIFVMRFLVGFFSGVSYPIMHGIWGDWAPPIERSRLASIHFAGSSVGAVLIFPLSGFLAKTYGWQSAFYTSGSLGLLWSVCWLLLEHDTPAEHPRISIKEKEYIQKSLYESAGSERDKRKRAVPWKKMFSSLPFLCVAFAQFASNLGSFMVMTMLPTYLATIMHFDAKASGLLSSIPVALKAILGLTTGYLADWIISKGVKTIYVRKAFGTASLMIPAVGILVVSFLDCNVTATVVFFTAVVGLDALTVPGFKTCLVDIAPQYCGIMFSVGNTWSSVAGFAGPEIVGAFRETYKENPIYGWRASFALGAGIYVLGAIFFLISGSSDLQPWAKDHQEEINLEEAKPISSN